MGRAGATRRDPSVSNFEARVDDEPVAPPTDGAVEWLDHANGIARVRVGERRETVLVEGAADRWTVTLRGRRIEVAVLSWRERVWAEAERAAHPLGGPVEVRASLPGLIVAIDVEPGSEVTAGARLITIEAMKMQNEVRAPRAGRVTEVAVRPGEAVAAGALLLRLEAGSGTG